MKYKNIKNTPKVFRFSSDIPFPSNFHYQAARPAWEKSRPPHMADDGHSATVSFCAFLHKYLFSHTLLIM